MSETTVYIAFDLTALGGDYFTLDDTTKGLLNGDYILGGDILVDVTDHVASVSINRGKSRELDRFNAGNATIVLHNDDRTFDPFYSASPYYGQILPRKQVVIESNGIKQFSGFIDDWDLEYQLGGKSFATVTCADGFMQLASAQLPSLYTISQKSGERINSVLNRTEVAWPISLRNIETGQQTLTNDLIAENTNVLSYLQLIESSEPGALFISKDGSVTFKDRINYPPSGDIIFADDGRANSVKYKNMQVIYGSELLHNRITITRNNGYPQTADDTVSQSKYGVQTFSQDNLLIDSDENSLILAKYLVSKYSEPELRFASIGVTLHDKTPTQQSLLLNLEINDIVQVVFTPNELGAEINEFAQIVGISHAIGVTQHEIEFSFSSITGLPFVLDSATYGVLGGYSTTYNNSSTTYSDGTKGYYGIFIDGYGLGF